MKTQMPNLRRVHTQVFDHYIFEKRDRYHHSQDYINLRWLAINTFKHTLCDELLY